MATASIEIDAALGSDSVRRKQVLQKNSVQRSAQAATQRSLEAQRRSKQAQLSKEEKELRAKFHRLQDERRALADNSVLGMYIHLSPTSDESRPLIGQLARVYDLVCRGKSLCQAKEEAGGCTCS